MSTSDLTVRIHARLDELAAAVAAADGPTPDTDGPTPDTGEPTLAAGGSTPDPGVLVALSGGPDSVALLALTVGWGRERGRPVAAAHFHHGLRGAAADADQRFCAELCGALGVPLTTGQGDPRGLARQRGRGLEDAARELRLAFLERTRRSADLAAIATGHHRDDQTETVLLRLFRGTGLDGLRGMAPRRGRLIRPLLDVPRGELLAWLDREGLSWRQDTTNTDGSNRRGRVRCELLPLVRDIFGPGAAAAPARLAELAATDLDLLDHLADQAATRHLGEPLAGHHGASLGCAVVGEHPAIARRVVRAWLERSLPGDLARVHVIEVLDWLAAGQSGTGLDLPGPVRLERVFDRVGPAGPAPPPLDPAAWRVRAEPLAATPDPVPPAGGGPDRWQLVCPAAALRGNLQVRAPRQGDRLRPFGLGGTRKLNALLQEKRVPAARRPAVPVVADAEGPLWVPGVAQDERTRVLPSCQQAVTIILERRRSDPDT